MSSVPSILYIGLDDAQVLLSRLAGVRRYAAARGLEVVTVPNKGVKAAVEAFLSRRRPKGCVVECHAGKTDLEPSLFGSVPVVYLNPSPGLFGGCRIASVAQDDAAIVGVAMRELAGNHPSAYAYVGYDWPASWDAARQEAFRRFAEASGLPASVFDNPVTPSGGGTARATALRRWLAMLPRRCGILASNDRIAAETVEAARAEHLSFPHDFTLVGIDNDEGYSNREGSSISTVRTDDERMGFLAAKMAVEQSAPVQARIGPLLVVRRKSTRGSGRREPYILEAVEAIRREACDGLEPRDLIARFPVSRRLFEMRFREAMGHSVLDEIRQVRLERVLTLLTGTDTPISAISDFCGFGSGDALRELFHARMGMSMREFRAKTRLRIPCANCPIGRLRRGIIEPK